MNLLAVMVQYYGGQDRDLVPPRRSTRAEGGFRGRPTRPARPSLLDAERKLFESSTRFAQPRKQLTTRSQQRTLPPPLDPSAPRASARPAAADDLFRSGARSPALAEHELV
jgi:hypothetical protein